MRSKNKDPKQYRRWRRHMRVRNRIVGTPERPRVAVFRSAKHIYAQIIDDTTGRTIATVSSLKLEPVKAAPAPAEADKKKDEGKKKKEAKGGKKAAKAAPPVGGKTLQAREVGRMLAEAAKAKGITRITFDRGGYLYHGRVAALAQAARENGLEF